MKMRRYYIYAMLVLSMLMPANAAPSPVYPTPQVMELKAGETQVQRVVLKMRQMNSEDGLWQRLPANKEGGYAISITPGKLEVCANDSDGVFYAKQTISQLLGKKGAALQAHSDPFEDESLEQVAKKGKLPLGCIVDWPDVANRGVVEGYYGTPWSGKARQSIFRFMGRNKLNTYIYAPKDDPYHHGAGCYKPYPPEKAAEIRELVQVARRNHVHFVWAIHPANTVRWAENGGKNQLNALCEKMQMMYDLGVRDFGVLVDDSSGEIGKVERQVELCNYLLVNFIRKHPDVAQTLTMCPTGYNRSWTNANFLTKLGEGLHKDIHVMWTGDTVVNDITLPGQRWVTGHLKRPTYIWWNWPCSDFKRSRLSMGRTYGLSQDAEMLSTLSGFVANPMEQAEANKVALFGVADYTWNIAAFDSENSWHAGVKRLYPADQKAMQVFCDHNSFLLPNNHGYYREESVRVLPTAEAFVRSIEAEKPDMKLAESLRKEYAAMAQAGKRLSTSKAIPELRAEIDSWFKQFERVGFAGSRALDALAEQDVNRRMSIFFEALDKMVEMKTAERMEWNGGRPKPVADVEVSMYIMTPLMRKTMRYISRALYSQIAGRRVEMPTFRVSRGNAEANKAAIEDDNPRTFWASGSRQQEGDWYCLDFGSVITIRYINMLMGGPRANDYATAGQFEVSSNGDKWRPVGEERNGPQAVLNLSHEPVRARMVRFRITKPRANWLSICEFTVNRILPPFVSHNLSSHPNLTASKTDTIVSINRVMELFTIKPGEYIELEIPTLIVPAWVEINVENADLAKWGKVELVTADNQTIPVQAKVEKNRLYVKGGVISKKPVRALRLSHVGDAPQEIKLTLFRMGVEGSTAIQSSDLLVDNDLSSVVSCDSMGVDVNIPVPPSVEEAIVVGTAECRLDGAQPIGEATPYVRRYKLPKEIRVLHLTAPRQSGKYISEVIFK